MYKFSYIVYVATIKTTPEYREWLKQLNNKGIQLIESRLHNIREFDYYGKKNEGYKIFDILGELRWKNGLRVYFSIVELKNGESCLLLFGGNKNGQNKDIKKARKILSKFISGEYAEGEVEDI